MTNHMGRMERRVRAGPSAPLCSQDDDHHGSGTVRLEAQGRDPVRDQRQRDQRGAPETHRQGRRLQTGELLNVIMLILELCHPMLVALILSRHNSDLHWSEGYVRRFVRLLQCRSLMLLYAEAELRTMADN